MLYWMSDWCHRCFGSYFMCQFNWKYCVCLYRGHIWENPYGRWGRDNPSCDGHMGNRKTGMQTLYMSQNIHLSNLLDELANVNKRKSEGMWSSGGCMCLPVVSLCFPDTSLTYRATMPFVQCCGKNVATCCQWLNSIERCPAVSKQHTAGPCCWPRSQVHWSLWGLITPLSMTLLCEVCLATRLFWTQELFIEINNSVLTEYRKKKIYSAAQHFPYSLLMVIFQHMHKCLKG